MGSQRPEELLAGVATQHMLIVDQNLHLLPGDEAASDEQHQQGKHEDDGRQRDGGNDDLQHA